MEATLTNAFEAVAKNLREFGYPSATGEQVHEVWSAMQRGEKVPHGIVGMFAERQIKEHPQIFGTVAELSN